MVELAKKHYDCEAKDLRKRAYEFHLDNGYESEKDKIRLHTDFHRYFLQCKSNLNQNYVFDADLTFLIIIHDRSNVMVAICIVPKLNKLSQAVKLQY